LSLFRRTEKKLAVKEGIDLTMDETRSTKIEMIPLREVMT
jgi:hypothetical protein